MPYRVEQAVSGRAGCQATECKKHGIKIDKDDLRLGTWVEMKDRASWHWRHWGCVSGKQLQNLRSDLEGNEPGTYRWDALDGYGDDGKGSLHDSPDLQEKVRRVVTQGFIDAEDWNGDPEMNKLGETGLYTPATKKKQRADAINNNHELQEMEEKLTEMIAERNALLQKGRSTAKLDVKVEAAQNNLDEHKASFDAKTPTKKRARAMKDDDDEDAKENKPAKKQRTAKAKKEFGTDDEDVKPAKKSRAAKVKEESDTDDEDVKPAKKKRPVKAKMDADTDDEDAKPAKKNRAAKMESDTDAEDVKPAPMKSRAKRPIKNKAKEISDLDKQDIKPVAANKGRAKKAIKEETKEEANMDAPAVFAAPKNRTARSKKAVKEEPVNGGEPLTTKAAPKKRDAAGKKAAKVESSPLSSSPLSDLHETSNDIGLASEPTEVLAVTSGADKHDDIDEGKKPKGKASRVKKVARGSSGGTASRPSRSRTASRTTSG